MNTAYLESLHICFCCFFLPLWGLVYIDEHLKKQIVGVGETARFVCLTAIHPADVQQVIVVWTHDGVPVNLTRHNKYSYQRHANQHILVIEHTDYRDSGEYSCQAKAGTVEDVSTAHLTVLGVPEPPKNLQLISCHGQSAELVWDPGDEHGASIRMYTVQFNASYQPDTWHDYSEPFDGETANALVSVSPWGTYAFTVIAHNSAGPSEPSNVTSSSCSAPPDKPDRNPKNVHARTDTKGKLVIEWQPMERLYQHGPGFRYHVFWRQSSSTYWNSAYQNDAAADSYEIDVDTVYGLYDIRVKAENDLGESHQPAFVFKGHSGEDEPIVVPKDFRLDRSRPLTSSTAHFIWEAVETSVDKIQGHFEGYRLEYWKSSEGRHKMKQTDIIVPHEQKDEPDVRAAISGLPSYTAVRAQVVVVNTHYSGPPSHIIDFFVPEGDGLDSGYELGTHLY
ncbi:neuroglian-like isoform X2 [Gigantopelta aegis]|uniref:neuroglian-like isoform X2 n=1 Tax=Gigantopelta aegis TaxID=1735272 RepID=UPI001B889D4A|nr:neuroglian-like isoform X2 [Gigantopelta aegis]